MSIETIDGKRGILVDVNDPTSLREGLLEIYRAIGTLASVVGAAVALANERKEFSLASALGRCIDGAMQTGLDSPILDDLRHALNADFPQPPNPGKRFAVIVGDRKAA